MIYRIIVLFGILASCAVLKSDKGSSSTYLFDLSELPAEDQNKLKTDFGIHTLDAQRGEIQMSKAAFDNAVQYFFDKVVLNKETESMDFYLLQSRPRVKYWEHVVNQLPEYVKYGYKYDGYTDSKIKKDKLLAYLVYRIDRNPQNLQKVWDDSKALVFSLLSKQKYTSSQLEDYVETLLISHDYMTKLKEYDGLMHEIYSEIEHEDEIEDMFGRTSNQFPFYEAIICPAILEKYRGSNGMVLNEYGEFTDVLWFHSFWVRRYHEGNTEVTVKILKELKAHYAKK